MALGAALNPEEDPQYLAFQRALGVDENTARQQAALQRSQLQRAYLAQLPQIQDSLTQANEGVDSSFLARGIFGAGEQAVQKTRNITSAERATQDAGVTNYEGQASLESALARQIAQGRRQQAELGLTTRSQLAIDSANAGV